VQAVTPEEERDGRKRIVLARGRKPGYVGKRGKTTVAKLKKNLRPEGGIGKKRKFHKIPIKGQEDHYASSARESSRNAEKGSPNVGNLPITT